MCIQRIRELKAHKRKLEQENIARKESIVNREKIEAKRELLREKQAAREERQTERRNKRAEEKESLAQERMTRHRSLESVKTLPHVHLCSVSETLCGEIFGKEMFSAEKVAAETKAKAKEDARIAAEKVAAKAKVEEEARIAAEKAAAEAKAKAEEEARLAAEKAAAKAKAEEEARIVEEEAAAKAKAKAEGHIAAEKAAVEVKAKAEDEARVAAEKAAAKAKAKAEEEARIAAEKAAAEAKAKAGEEARVAAEKEAAEAKANAEEEAHVAAEMHHQLKLLTDEADVALFNLGLSDTCATEAVLSVAGGRLATIFRLLIKFTPTFRRKNVRGFFEAVPVSCFFDADDDPNSSFAEQGIHPADAGKYAASAIVVYDLDGQYCKSKVHLDLTTDDAQSSSDPSTSGSVALALIPPTVADLDGDGILEIIVGTSFGLLYVLEMKDPDCSVKEMFPVRVGEIRDQVAVSHVTGNATVHDLFGSLSAVRLGDVDGNGMLDVVAVSITTNNNSVGGTHKQQHTVTHQLNVWTLHASNGEPLVHHPIVIDILPTHDKESLDRVDLLSTLRGDTIDVEYVKLLNDLATSTFMVDATANPKPHTPGYGGDARGLHILIPAPDGNIYIVEGGSGCTQKLTVGAPLNPLLLADELTGDGRFSIVASTTDEQLLAFETPLPAHPLNVWEGVVRGRRNGFVHGYGGASQGGGFLVTEESAALTGIAQALLYLSNWYCVLKVFILIFKYLTRHSFLNSKSYNFQGVKYRSCNRLSSWRSNPR